MCPCVLTRGGALLILFMVLFVFQPVFVVQAVSYGGTFEGLDSLKLLINRLPRLAEVGPAQVGPIKQL